MPVRREAIDTQQQATTLESNAVGRGDHKHDCDWVIVGSGFGGSVSALRLADKGYRVFGYENLMICDGSTMPANPGVNPSLTITAIAEHAMTAVPVSVAVAGSEQAIISA